jgi:hypothetical protein
MVANPETKSFTVAIDGKLMRKLAVSTIEGADWTTWLTSPPSNFSPGVSQGGWLEIAAWLAVDPPSSTQRLCRA